VSTDAGRPADAPVVPPAVAAALERLAALSVRAPTEQPSPPPARPLRPAPAVAPDLAARSRADQPATVTAPATRTTHAQPQPAAPSVHIGTIDVTIAPPPPAPTPPAPAARPVAVAAPPAAITRLSRPSFGYGFGQG